MSPESGRRGHSLVELLVAVLLLATLATACVALLTVQLRLVRTVASLSEAGNAVRFASRLLRSELRSLVTTRDLDGVGPDSSRQRVFRGMGVTCASTGTAAEIRYRGLRDPDPTKDSVLVISTNGESVEPLVAVRTPSAPVCTAAAGEKILELETTAILPPAGIVLLFERGTWHLTASALRYSRGRGGRQPITAAVLVDDSTRITMSSVGGLPIGFHLEIAAMVAGSQAPGGLVRESSRIALLNLAIPLDSAVLVP